MMKIIKILFLAIWLGTILFFFSYVTYTIVTKGWDEFIRPAKEAMEAMAEQTKPSLPTPHD